MIEVHPPEHHIFTWKQFFLHMGTICLGLLIAIGLEQAVEWMHRRSERAELRQQLREESEQIAKDTRGSIERWVQETITIRLRRDALFDAAQGGHLRPQPASRTPSDVDMPNDPFWQAAKTGNVASLLTREEVVARGELNVLCAQTHEADNSLTAASQTATAFIARFGREAFLNGTLHASKEDLLTAVQDLTLSLYARNTEMIFAASTLAAAEQTAQGEYRLPVLYAAEHKEQLRVFSEIGEGIKKAKAAELQQQGAPPSSPH